jgi:bisanhydrobacterioruberin hydratase
MYKKYWVLLGVGVVSYFAIRFADTSSPVVSIISLLLFGLPVLFVLGGGDRTRNIVAVLLLSILAWGLEILSITQGIPYGFFRYGESLGPLLLGLVPYSLPLAWPLVVLSVHSMTQDKSILSGVGLGVLLLVLYDLILDPIAVGTKMWKYNSIGWYYSVPWSNYAGWLLSGALGLWLLRLLKIQLGTTGSLTYWIHITFWTGCAIWLGYWIPVGIGIALLVAMISYSPRQQKTPSNT